MTHIEGQLSVNDITSVAGYFLIPSITIPIPSRNSNLIGPLISKHDPFGIKMLFFAVRFADDDNMKYPFRLPGIIKLSII